MSHWLDTHRMPLVESLYAYAGLRPGRWHVPGHKGNSLFPSPLEEHLQSVFPLDATELPGLDDLFHPSGPIAEAEKKAAALFGADRTFFLVNGSTAGNIAMLLAVCGPEEAVLVPRNIHRSLFHALVLGRIRPVFLPVGWDESFSVATWPSLPDVEKALREHPEVRAVVLTYPTYHGLCMPLQEYADVIHRHGRVLLVDEAHGAHFALHSGLPPTALSCGADACVQSTHKMLGSLTQSSMLHLRNGRVDERRVANVLAMIQSSSPSYLLLASLDAARAYAAAEGPARIAELLPALAAFRDAINAIGPLRCFGEAEAQRLQGMYDPFKLLISVEDSGMSGHEWYIRLCEEKNQWLELAGINHVLAVVGLGDRASDLHQLAQAVKGLLKSNGRVVPIKRMDISSLAACFTTIPEMGVLPFESFYTEKCRVRLEDAEGKWSGEAVIPYPPGIPLLFPGERIGRQHIEAVRALRQSGVVLQGMADYSAETIAVLQRS
jgi:arginine decarboxylase